MISFLSMSVRICACGYSSVCEIRDVGHLQSSDLCNGLTGSVICV